MTNTDKCIKLYELICEYEKEQPESLKKDVRKIENYYKKLELLFKHKKERSVFPRRVLFFEIIAELIGGLSGRYKEYHDEKNENKFKEELRVVIDEANYRIYDIDKKVVELIIKKRDMNFIADNTHNIEKLYNVDINYIIYKKGLNIRGIKDFNYSYRSYGAHFDQFFFEQVGESKVMPYEKFLRVLSLGKNIVAATNDNKKKTWVVEELKNIVVNHKGIVPNNLIKLSEIINEIIEKNGVLSKKIDTEMWESKEDLIKIEEDKVINRIVFSLSPIKCKGKIVSSDIDTIINKYMSNCDIEFSYSVIEDKGMLSPARELLIEYNKLNELQKKAINYFFNNIFDEELSYSFILELDRLPFDIIEGDIKRDTVPKEGIEDKNNNKLINTNISTSYIYKESEIKNELGIVFKNKKYNLLAFRSIVNVVTSSIEEILKVKVANIIRNKKDKNTLGYIVLGENEKDKINEVRDYLSKCNEYFMLNEEVTREDPEYIKKELHKVWLLECVNKVSKENIVSNKKKIKL